MYYALVTLYSACGSENGFSRIVFPTGLAGGLPRAPDGTGLPPGVRLGQRNPRMTVFGPDGGPYRVR